MPKPTTAGPAEATTAAPADTQQASPTNATPATPAEVKTQLTPTVLPPRDKHAGVSGTFVVDAVTGIRQPANPSV